MTYVADWQRLPDVLTLLTDAGLETLPAKEIACSLIADAKLRVRLTPVDPIPGSADTFSGPNIKIPSHLKPNDFDWEASRPLKPWHIGPRDWISAERHCFAWKPRAIALIEILRSDVVKFVDASFARAVRVGSLALREKTEAEYKKWQEEFRLSKQRFPTREESEKWARERNLSRDRVRKLRRLFVPEEVQKGGAPRGVRKKPGEK